MFRLFTLSYCSSCPRKVCFNLSTCNPTLLRRSISNTQKVFLTTKGSSHYRADREEEARAEVGRIIDTLPKNLEDFINCNYPLNPSLYSSNIELSEPFTTGFHLRGKRSYLSLSRLARCLLKWYFKERHFQVTALTQQRPGDPEYDWYRPCDDGGEASMSKVEEMHESERISLDSKTQTNRDSSSRSGSCTQPDPTRIHLRMRWTFSGTPRQFSLLPASPERPQRSVTTGVFIYAFDSRGKINVHRIQRVHPAPTNRLWGSSTWAWLIGGRVRPVEWGLAASVMPANEFAPEAATENKPNQQVQKSPTYTCVRK